MALIENLSVKEVYNRIAKHFNASRQRIWGSVKHYLDSLELGTSVLDMGCGNGKNMLYRKDLNICGIDISHELVKICLDKNLNVKEGCITKLDFNSESFSNIICIAAYHHLDNDNDRQKCLNEVYRCLVKGGSCLITVWSMEQDEKSAFHFSKRDELVPWVSQNDGNTYLRYYHIYRKGDLIEEIGRLCGKFNIITCGWELGNWYVILQKPS